jgi:hypothetical protein
MVMEPVGAFLIGTPARLVPLADFHPLLPFVTT